MFPNRNYHHLLAGAICLGVATLLDLSTTAQILFVGNVGNGIITELTTNGVASIFADGVNMNSPRGLAFNNAGDLFVADFGSGNIYEFTPDGVQSIFASGLYPYGLTFNSAGNLFEADSTGKIFEFSTNGVKSIFAALSSYAPNGLVFDSSGDLFVGSGDNIYEFTTNGVQTTFASGLDGSFGLAFDSAGNLFEADYGSGKIYEFSTNGVRSTFASGLSYPYGLAFDSAGDLFEADSGSGEIYEFTTNGVRSTFASALPAYALAFEFPVPALISRQPQSQMAVLFSNVVFTVAAYGVPPASFQWYFSNTNLQGGAGAYAQMFDGFVYGAVVTNSGSGYTTVPSVQFIGGDGSGAGAYAVLSNGMVAAIAVTNAGSDYATVPAVQIDPPNGLLIGQTNSTLNLNDITTNKVGNYFVVVSNAYGSATSSVATLTIAYTPGILKQPQSVNVAQFGTAVFNVTPCGTPPFGYQWWMASETQSNAAAVPFVTNGFVLAANITGGAGYLFVPQVQIIGGNGSGAGGYASVSNRMVSAITMTNAGFGYASPPEIEIAAPGGISLSGQTSTNLILPAVNAANDGDYFVVVTNNYGSVTSMMAALTVFLPPQEFNVSSANGSKLRFQLTGTADYPYILQTTTNLTPPINWQAVVTNPADANGNWTFTITNLTSIPGRFYRAAGQ